MKTLFTVALALLTTQLFSQAQYRYFFNNNFQGDAINAPLLTQLGTGNFEIDTLKKLGNAARFVYRFNDGSGLQFNAGPSNYLGNNYTIEMYFKFDQFSGYKRVLDFKNRTTDNGLYFADEYVEFYPIDFSDPTNIAAGQYSFLTLSRHADGLVRVYLDGALLFSFNDTGNDAVLGPDNLLNLFQDDTITAETSAGTIAYFAVHNSALDSLTVLHNYNNLANQLMVGVESVKPGAFAVSAVNPVTNTFLMSVNSQKQDELVWSLFDIKGRMIKSSAVEVGAGANFVSVDISAVAPGLYLAVVQGKTGERSVHKVVKQ